jgi:hypothetical protein
MVPPAFRRRTVILIVIDCATGHYETIMAPLREAELRDAPAQIISFPARQKLVIDHDASDESDCDPATWG